jgi:hypothetical protein
MLCIVTFAERGKKTAMTFQKGPFDSSEELESEYEGWNECFDRLDEYLRTGHVTITPYE